MTTDDTYTLYHNPKCSKSCAVKAILEERGARFQVTNYMEDPLTEQDLLSIMQKLGTEDPRDMMRIHGREFGEIGCDELQGEDLVRAMVANRILIQRPILVRGNRAVIGRPVQKVEELLDH